MKFCRLPRGDWWAWPHFQN